MYASVMLKTLGHFSNTNVTSKSYTRSNKCKNLARFLLRNLING